jgi:hypothetical protein
VLELSLGFKHTVGRQVWLMVDVLVGNRKMGKGSLVPSEPNRRWPSVQAVIECNTQLTTESNAHVTRSKIHHQGNMGEERHLLVAFGTSYRLGRCLVTEFPGPSLLQEYRTRRCTVMTNSPLFHAEHAKYRGQQTALYHLSQVSSRNPAIWETSSEKKFAERRPHAVLELFEGVMAFDDWEKGIWLEVYSVILCLLD